MELDEFVDKQVADCRRFYELGDYRQLITAFRWCTMYDRPLPAWVADEALNALKFIYETGGAPGKGKTGGPKTKLIRSKVHRERHRVAAWQLARRDIDGGNREAAFERASAHLRGTFAQGSARAVEDSYNLIATELARLKAAN